MGRRLLGLLLGVLAAGERARCAEDFVLRLGERAPPVAAVTLELAAAETCTLARSGGGLLRVLDAAGRVLAEDEDGWRTVDLAAGRYRVELPGDPSTLTALRGAFAPPASALACQATLNDGLARHGEDDYEGARQALLAYLVRPAPVEYRHVAQVFLADLLRREERFPEARALLDESLEQALRLEPSIAPFGHSLLGHVALAQRDLSAARAAFDRLRASAGSPGEVAAAVSSSAQVAEAERDFTRSRELHAEALALLDETVPPYTRVHVRFAAARFHQERGELAQATALLEAAVAEATSWDQQVFAAGQLGLVHLARGHYGAAQVCFDRIAGVAAEHAPSPFDAKILRNQAALAFELGEYGRAREHLQELLRADLSPGERGSVLSDLALLTSLQGDQETAATLYEQASSALPPDHPERWRLLVGQAALQRRTSRLSAAEASARQALDLARVREDGWAEALCLITLGDVHTLLGDPGRGKAESEAAVAELSRRGAAALLLPALHSLAAAELALGNLPAVDALLERAFDLAGAPELVGREGLEAARIRSRLSELSEWSELAVDLTARRLGEPAADGPAVLAAGFLRAARWKERALLEGAPGGSALPEDLPAVLARILGPRRLVQYVSGTKELYAYVLDGAGLRLLDLGPRAPIEEAALRFVAGLTDGERLADLATVAREGHALHEQLLAPLGPSAESLVIVPAGELSRLPFEALVAAAPESPATFAELTFVLDRADVSYAPSAAVLAALSLRPPRAGAKRALLVGDPVYASERASGQLALRGSVAGEWPRLPRSRREVTDLARLLLLAERPPGIQEDLLRLSEVEQQRDAALVTDVFDLCLGREASAGVLAERGPEADLIHVAAHGEVDPWDPRRSGLVLSWNEEDAGLVSLAEIAALRLDARLVVLSACRSADGRLLRGEGVQSMAQAFLLAGARGVVATLWPVEDADAEQIMQRFSRGLLLEGETPAHALRAARQALRHGTVERGRQLPGSGSRSAIRAGHPHGWAAFLYTGALTGGTQ